MKSEKSIDKLGIWISENFLLDFNQNAGQTHTVAKNLGATVLVGEGRVTSILAKLTH
jgi:hypothetical protein